MALFKENWFYLVRVVLIILVIALALWASWVIKDNEFVGELIRRFGYVGIFLVSVVSGFNLVVPIPTVSFFPAFLVSGLNAFALIIVISAGMALADFIGYLLGKAGRYIALSAFERKVINKFERFKERLNWSPMLALFLFSSFVPLPNEIVVVPMGFLGYRPISVFPPLFFGHMVFNSLYAFGAVNIIKLIS
ncbi:MAG: hypothetical protein HYX22_00675 [Candidatus Yanofskybacteria bacterium]|nr:hypothetical protein [Candidatus Yanofskybacteria bacterium]